MSIETSPESQLLEEVKAIRLHMAGLHELIARMNRRMLLAEGSLVATASFTTRTHAGEAVLSSLDKAAASVESLAAHAEAGAETARQQAQKAESVTAHLLSEDVERVIPAPAPAAAPAAQKVEIVHDGGRRLLFIDGKRIDKVLTIETPRDKDSIAGMVKVSFVASEIVEREVSREQFAALLRGEAG